MAEVVIYLHSGRGNGVPQGKREVRTRVERGLHRQARDGKEENPFKNLFSEEDAKHKDRP